ncbi:MAG TPA: CaiB/BaiF CoA-transferase family protein [Syntrophales bacterium]|nr:CaiB/BaiF CoA-transferase family protein [Syntrophales bacterium]
MSLPLAGIRILDLSAVLPGSFCTQFLADLGAEVIKIEPPAGGDPGRSIPPLVKKTSVFFHMSNRNKKSVTLDLRNEVGRAILLRLVERSDVFVENTRPGNPERIGLGYDDLAGINPRIIYCSITGFGKDGPFRDIPAHDINFLALSGILGLIGEKGHGPAIPDIQIAGAGAGGMNAAMGILSALLRRERTGKGQYIDAAILDGLIPFLTLSMCLYMLDGREPRRGESIVSGGCAFWNVYQTKDGHYISLGCWENKYWENFCRAVNREDLAGEQHAPPRRQDEIISEVRAIFMEKTRDEWLKLLNPKDVCYAPVNSLGEALEHPQIRHRGLWFKAAHPEDGEIPQPGFPLKFSEDQPGWRTPPPSHGEHTREILKELGITNAELAEMKAAGII